MTIEKPRQAADEATRLRAVINISTGVIVASTLCVGIVQYMMPAGFTSLFKADHIGTRLFKDALGLGHLATISTPAFIAWFRAFTLCAYAAYAALLFAASRATAVDLRRGVLLIGVVSVAVAIFYPPSMSSDLFSYIAYAEMPARYHLNPYLTSPQVLVAAGDPIVAYLPHIDPRSPASGLKWDIPTVYGPVWTSASVLISWLVGENIFLTAVLLKLLEAAALIVAAVSVYRIATVAAPGRAHVAFLAVGLNPLLLAEGPGNGHNDLLMMAFILLAGAELSRGRPTRAGLSLGIAASIKFIPIIVLPWMLIEYWPNFGRGPGMRGSTNEFGDSGNSSPSRFGRGGEERAGVGSKFGAVMRSRLLGIARFLAAFTAPISICFIPYWAGMSTLRAIFLRGTIKPAAGHKLSEAIAIPAQPPNLSSILHSYGFLIVGYLLLTAFVFMTARRQNPGSRTGTTTVAWSIAWTLEAGAFAYFVLKLMFPWYVIWTWPASAVSWNRLHFNVLLFFSTFGLMTTWLYTLSSAQFASTLVIYYILSIVVGMVGIHMISYVNKINKKTYTVELCIFSKSAV